MWLLEWQLSLLLGNNEAEVVTDALSRSLQKAGCVGCCLFGFVI